MKILKKGGGSREKGEEETKSMPHAPVVFTVKYICLVIHTKCMFFLPLGFVLYKIITRLCDKIAG